jgi:hypothetical protein
MGDDGDGDVGDASLPSPPQAASVNATSPQTTEPVFFMMCSL